METRGPGGGHDVCTEADQRLAAAFRRELSERTRLTGAAGSIVALVGYLCWSVFDRVLEPAHAAEFLRIRLTVGVVLVAAIALLASGWARERVAELVTLAILGSVQIGVAWMLPRIDTHLPAYLLGYTLTIYGCALLVEWHWTYTVTAVGLSWTALAIANLCAPDPMSAQDLTLSIAYVVTASVISLVGQWLRYRTSRREFSARVEAERARADAEREREQNLALLQRLDHLSQHDPLTELANRRLFDATLTREVARADREGSALALVLLDIDHFKALNDTLGHQAGDGVLRVVASALAARLRAEDLPARYGGEEFALILPGVRTGDVLPAVDDLRRTVHEATRANGCPMAVTVSAGVALYPHHAHNGDDLLRVADVALYAAKAAGRDRTLLAPPVGAVDARSHH